MAGLALTVGARLHRQLHERETDEAPLDDTMSSFLRLGTVLINLLIGIVVLMVLKPGAG